MMTTTVNQYKRYIKFYIQKHNTCKEDETIRTKQKKIEKNEDESTYLKKKQKKTKEKWKSKKVRMEGVFPREKMRRKEVSC